MKFPKPISERRNYKHVRNGSARLTRGRPIQVIEMSNGVSKFIKHAPQDKCIVTGGMRSEIKRAS